MVKLLISLVVWSASYVGCAKEISFKAWVKEYFSKNRYESFVSLGFVEIKSESQTPKFITIDNGAYDKSGVFQTLVAEQGDWNYLVNRHPWEEKSNKLSTTELLNLLHYSSQIDVLVVNIPDKNSWIVFGAQDGRLEKLAVEKSPPEFKNYNDVLAKLHQSLGFQGVVLDQRDGVLLVVMGVSTIRKKAQAIVIEDSVKKVGFPVKVKEADALIEHIQSAGRLALFKIVLNTGTKSILPGSKIKLNL